VSAPEPAPPPDRAAVEREAVEHLRALIRFPTVNPPGDELACAEYVHGVLARAGIESRVFEPATGRGIVVARLRASAAGAAGEVGARRALLLLAHMDVVGAEREHWTVDPFAGQIRDGRVYGRGAIDDKGMLAANLVAMLLAKRRLLDEGVPLTRDVVFVASADEETGSRWGLEWLLANHADLLRAEYALNEGGRIRVVAGAPLYAAVQTAEKVPHLVTVTARGTSGHASVPLPDNSIVRLARALSAIGAHREPLTIVPTTRRFFERLATVWPVAEERSAMADIVSGDPAREQRGEAVLARFPLLDALARNGLSATMLAGGIRENVIPAEATAVLNVRTLPGQSPDDVTARLAIAVNDPQVELSITSRGTDAPPSDFGSPMFAAVAETLTSLDPRLTVVPYMSTGATDSARLRATGVQTFGLLPFPLTPEDEARMHGHDERVGVDALGFGVRVVYGIVERMVTERAGA
jgi:acetylornithine deacetylase/succinyl-diaminopimelate desuccinylase-like protein